METFPENTALLLVDIQNDFCLRGSLAVADADQIIPVVNRLIPRFQIVVAGHDWHPPNHASFKHEGGPWPPHCVQHRRGAELHPLLDNSSIAFRVYKGSLSDHDQYSEFDGTTASGEKLDDLLKKHGIATLYVVGLATDYCVRATVLDALNRGYAVYVVEDAMRAVEVAAGDGRRALEEMKSGGAHIIRSRSVLAEARSNAAQG